MNLVLHVFFWLCAGTVFYVYFGYPILLLALAKIRPAPAVQEASVTPTVSLVIPAFNEDKSIAAKLENALALDYPRDKLEVIVASDGSTDRTNDIVREFNAIGVILVALETNQGKSAAENAGLAMATGDIVVLSDATGTYNSDALKALVAPFADASVGCVAGVVKYQNTRASVASGGEGMYWQYEVFLRLLESAVGNLTMASGSILACRRSLAQSLDEAVGEDFVIPMRAALRGFRTIYAPKAMSKELVAETDRALFKTKVRIISKDLRGLFSCSSILNPFRHPLYAWGLVSHKLLRWLVPYFLIIIFATNLFLLRQPLYALTLGFQVAFYAIALAAYFFGKEHRPSRFLDIPFSFCLVNLAALVGVARFVAGRTSGRWEPVRG